jgi:hypothetical protein
MINDGNSNGSNVYLKTEQSDERIKKPGTGIKVRSSMEISRRILSSTNTSVANKSTRNV